MCVSSRRLTVSSLTLLWITPISHDNEETFFTTEFAKQTDEHPGRAKNVDVEAQLGAWDALEDPLWIPTRMPSRDRPHPVVGRFKGKLGEIADFLSTFRSQAIFIKWPLILARNTGA